MLNKLTQNLYFCILFSMKGFVQMSKKCIAVFLLFLFIGYTGSITLFCHTHIVDKQLVTHSHPYSNVPDTGQHTHTSFEFVTLAVLSLLLMLAATSGWFASIYTIKLLKKTDLVQNQALSHHLSTSFLRGPPVC